MGATPRVRIEFRPSEKSGQALMAASSRLSWLCRRPPLDPQEYVAGLRQAVGWIEEVIAEAAAVAAKLS